MPRGKRKSFDDKIASAENQIVMTEQKLNALKSELSELLELKQQEETSEIYNIMKENNISISQLREMLSNTVS